MSVGACWCIVVAKSSLTVYHRRPLAIMSSGGDQPAVDPQGLSAEQLKRMERNRRRALEKRSFKRAGPPVSSRQCGSQSAVLSAQCRPAAPHRETQTIGPPPMKVPAYSILTSSSTPSSAATGTLRALQTPSNSCQTSDFTQDRSAAVSVQTSASATVQVLSTVGPSPQHGKVMSSGATVQVLSTVGAGPWQGKAMSSTGGRDSAATETTLRFSESRRRIKANFALVTKSRFKAIVQYDAMIIEIFKRVPSRAYGKF